MRGLCQHRAAVVLALLTVMQANGALAVELPGLAGLGGQEGKVIIDAESVSYDEHASVMTAEGAVRITYGSLVLTADRVTIDRQTGVAEARGMVELTSPEGVVEARFVRINFREETGWMDDAELLLGPNNLRLSGSRIKKLAGQRYEIRGGELTTCLCPEGGHPSWNLRSEHVVVDLYGSGRFQDGKFEIMGRPVFYIPAGFFPVRKRRQSGLLRPRFGLSSFRGVQFEQPIYWAINKSMDATLGIDVESGSRVGLVGEYRYIFSQDSRGELGASYFNETMRGLSSADVVNRQIADPTIPENRWSVRAWHEQKLSQHLRAYVDARRVGDDLLLREVNAFSFDPVVDVSMRTRRFERTRVGLVENLPWGLLRLDGRFYQDFINPDGLTFDVAPDLLAHLEHGFISGRLVGRLEAQASNFERGEGFQGRRLQLQPAVELPWHWRDVLHGFVEGGMRAAFYSLDSTDLPQGASPSAIGEIENRSARQFFYAVAEAGTALSRVYRLNDGKGGRLKHTIEPSLRYFYVPREAQRSTPLFDDLDRMRHRSVFTYGFTSRLLLKGAESKTGSGRQTIREIGRLAVGQSYDLLNEGSDGQHASDLDLGLRLFPADFFMLYGQSDVSVSNWQPRGTSVGFSIADPWSRAAATRPAELEGRTRLEASYRFVTGQGAGLTSSVPSGAQQGSTRVEEVNARLVLRTSKRLFLSAETRYDAVSKRFLENRYGVRLISQCDCWVIDLGISDRVNPNEVVVQATVTLVGLGSLGPAARGPWRGPALLQGWSSLF